MQICSMSCTVDDESSSSSSSSVHRDTICDKSSFSRVWFLKKTKKQQYVGRLPVYVLWTQPYTKPKSVNVTHRLIKLKDKTFIPTSGKLYFTGPDVMRKRSLKLWFSVELKCRWLLGFYKIEAEALTAVCQNQSHLLIRKLLFVRSRTASWIKLYLPDPQVLLCCSTVNHMNWANGRRNGKMQILESPRLYPCQVFLKQRHVASECSTGLQG